jgi:2-methylaconitate cis-trans-isomerase PrpF
MTQTAIPYLFMRGGTSRGPYFNRTDLPEDKDKLADALIAAIGAGHPLNIDGIGGGNAVTTKVAMLSRSEGDWADIDYFFAQVAVEERLVDFKPTCGNILSGVGAAAIEMGLLPADEGGVTEVKIRSVNTGARVISRVRTPAGKVTYAGETQIDGVPGTAAPVELNFLDVVGNATGALLPTGNLCDVIGGIEVTCMDVAMPMVIARAADFGLTGYESCAELNDNAGLFTRMETIRIEAGKMMGMGDVSKSVTPKFGLLAPATQGGTVATRYFMPWKAHPTMAVTGSQCLASCTLTPGTVADGLLKRPEGSPVKVVLEHPQGFMEVMIDYDTADGFLLNSAGLIRTARLLASGEVYVPSKIWPGQK